MIFSNLARQAILCLAAVVFSTGAQAWVRGVASANNQNTQVNLGTNAIGLGNLINVLKAGALTLDSTHMADGALLDDSGYIVGTPTGNIGLNWPSASVASQAYTGVQYKWVWTSDITFKFSFNSSISGCTAVNATCTSGTITTTPGQAGSVTFTNNSANISGFFPAGFTYAHGAGSMALYRVSDEAKYNAGQIWTDEFLTAVRGLRPGTIRLMGFVDRGSANFNGEVSWSYRITPQDLTWRASKLPHGAWGGVISGTDTYTASAAPDTPPTYTDGEIYIGYFVNKNTVTNPTINIGGRGAVPILNDQAIAVSTSGSNSIQIPSETVQPASLRYDGILGAFLYSRQGMVNSIPVEAQVNLANAVNANLWSIVGAWVNDDYVTNWASAVCSGLNSNLYFYPEYSNEIWNNAFPQTSWSYQRGLAFGFPDANNEPSYGYYGLRVRQIMGNLVPSACASRMATVRRTLMFKGADTYSQVLNYRFKGADLAPIAQGGKGNATYNLWTGSANYTASPNRPVDVVDVIGYAPYVTGTNLCRGPDVGCTPTSLNAPFYQALVTAWEAGNSATALDLIDNDVRQGTTYSTVRSSQTVTASGTTFTTPDAHGFVSGSTNVSFSVSGGTSYSGLASGQLYRVSSTPTSTTFTIQAYSNGSVSGGNINAGTAGSGTVSVGSTSNRSLLQVANLWYPLWEPLAAAFDADRPVGMSALRMEWYEGNLEPKGLSSAQCTSLGITGTDCSGSIALALVAWKNDSRSYATQQAYYSQFFGTDPAASSTFGLMPHSKTGANLVLSCDVDYELIPNCASITSTPYQLYYGMRDQTH